MANPTMTSKNEWSSGLFDCFSDASSCCLTIWCPCVTFGRIAEIVDEGGTTCCEGAAWYLLLLWLAPICAPLYSCGYRSKLRNQHSLESSPCNDCLVHFCCENCALCQEYRELQNRGFDMSVGWKGNVQKQTRGVAMAPTVEGGMKR
ncbi:Protein PLANT CADMIUM RESISTANCE 2 [Camellia lanceoleosa]|uniref:Protein PLANT CADMIUM RESISTANCE 2 n=1 Tax=Camellia lanceoleosa TaxID=1840588 RepID=A0ACC0IF76_9ERIC|nr:Protein PLANT CADMIUM RESISTANCE 2 [Camellia lanceoleosa]